MASQGTDNIAGKHEREFAQLRGRRSASIFRWAIVAVVLLIGGTLLFSAFGGFEDSGESLEISKRELRVSGGAWGRDLIESQELYHDWLYKRGTASEVRIFDAISLLMFQSASAFEPARSGSSIFTRVYLSLHSAILRVSFLVIASWRLWLIVIIVAGLYGIFSLKVYSGPTFLGQLGNNKLYFSGIRANLNRIHTSGAPDVQSIGLACPSRVSTTTSKVSDLGRILEKYGALCETNLWLAGIILDHAKWPAYLAYEPTLLDAMYEGGKLSENATLVLENTLALHKAYKEGSEVKFSENAALTGPVADRKLTMVEYADRLKLALHRVLTPGMRLTLGELSARDVAALVLSYEAGKSMTHSFEGSKWNRRSNYPQLNARAVLHSIPSYGGDFSFESRQYIRQAFVYGSRRSVFGPVNLPIGYDPRSRTLRQWVEILMACPHELQSVSDEVEAFGIIYEAHDAWCNKIIKGAVAMNPEIVEGVYATQGNLFFMPVRKVLNILRGSLDRKDISRLEVLVSLISQKQKIDSMSLTLSDDAQERVGSGPYSKVYSPLTMQEIKSLSQEYGLSIEDAKDWSTLRVILESFGWLGRRVGDYTVPHSSVIYAIMRAPESNHERNEFGFVGKAGVVPFRATRLASSWGKYWRSKFTEVSTATMAETKDVFSRLMRGEEDSDDEELEGATIAG